MKFGKHPSPCLTKCASKLSYLLHSIAFMVEKCQTLGVACTHNVSKAPNSSEARLTAPMMEVGPPVVSPASEQVMIHRTMIHMIIHYSRFGGHQFVWGVIAPHWPCARILLNQSGSLTEYPSPPGHRFQSIQSDSMLPSAYTLW